MLENKRCDSSATHLFFSVIRTIENRNTWRRNDAAAACSSTFSTLFYALLYFVAIREEKSAKTNGVLKLRHTLHYLIYVRSVSASVATFIFIWKKGNVELLVRETFSFG